MKAQSLVEFAITLPIIIILLSGVIEFGFALNYYLSLLDATREAARFYSDQDPFNGTADNASFYAGAAAMVRASLDPSVIDPSYKGRRIVLDPSTDDVIVSVFRVTGSTVTLRPTSGSFRLYSHQTPIFNSAAIQNQLISGAPNAGLVVVEVHYNYHQVLKLPWLTLFVPDPMMLRAYTIMPNRYAEP